MTATAPPTVHNRIAGHFAPPLPATPEERRATWTDTLMAAMRHYQRQLASPHPADAERAARAVFDLEKTRIRHGRELAGTAVPRADSPDDDLLATLPDLAPIRPSSATAGAAVLGAAVEAGAFDPEPKESPRREPVREKTDEELVDEFASNNPDDFQWLKQQYREAVAERGRTPSDDRLTELARGHLLKQVRVGRAEHRKAAGPGH